MTREEAIKVLEINKPTGVVFEDNNTQNRMADLCEALEMAIKALEKEIPKKPFYENYHGLWSYKKCPNCESVVYSSDWDKYTLRQHAYERCVYCGQKFTSLKKNSFDWEDE